MGLIITPQKEIDAYFASGAINQSSLKNLEGGLAGLLANIAKKKKDEHEGKPIPDYFLIGGAVDCILTGEVGEFEKQYYVSNLSKKPTEVEIKIVDSVFNELSKANMLLSDKVTYQDSHDSILAAANEVGWQKNWKDATRVNKLLVTGAEYFEDLKLAFGKKILSREQHENITYIVNSLSSNPKTKKYFDRALQKDQKFIDFYYQLPIYFNYKGEECKALMDLVVVHKNSTGEILKIEPIDLKTMSGATLGFPSKMRQHRYDIQAAWYTLALSEHFSFPIEMIAPFKFVVESTTGVGNPLVFEITANTLYNGQHGSPASTFRAKDTFREIYYREEKGYKRLMQDYIYYMNTEFREDIIFETYPDVVTIDYVKGIV